MKRVPDVVINRLFAAFEAFDIQADELMGLLKSFRRNRVRRIAIRGLTPGPVQVPGLENIPLEHLYNLAELDAALRAYAKCVTGDGHEYLSSKVYKAAFLLHQQHVARNPRASGSRRDRDEEMVKFLKKRGYFDLERGEKKSVVFDAYEKFAVSESVIRRVVTVLKKKSLNG